jgi:hypothetical protein
VLYPYIKKLKGVLAQREAQLSAALEQHDDSMLHSRSEAIEVRQELARVQSLLEESRRNEQRLKGLLKTEGRHGEDELDQLRQLELAYVRLGRAGLGELD